MPTLDKCHFVCDGMWWHFYVNNSVGESYRQSERVSDCFKLATVAGEFYVQDGSANEMHSHRDDDPLD